jgi:Zn finger protein HypA/HybF involved in hydrogenase expression
MDPYDTDDEWEFSCESCNRTITEDTWKEFGGRCPECYEEQRAQEEEAAAEAEFQ